MGGLLESDSCIDGLEATPGSSSTGAGINSRGTQDGKVTCGSSSSGSDYSDNEEADVLGAEDDDDEDEEGEEQGDGDERGAAEEMRDYMATLDDQLEEEEAEEAMEEQEDKAEQEKIGGNSTKPGKT